MKKCFYVILAAAAIVASCAKADFKEDQKFEPKDSATALFSGSIVQPNGLNTKTTLVNDLADQVSIEWQEGDEIVVEANDGAASPKFYRFFADRAGTEVYFGCTSDKVSEVSAWLLTNDVDGYTAYYPAYTYPSLPGTLDCASEQYGNQASLQNMPLKAVLNSVSLSSHEGRKLSFSSPYAILQFTVPSTLDADGMAVYLNNQADPFVYVDNIDQLDADASGNVVFYAPIPAEGEGYDQLTFVAKKGDVEVATMYTYSGSEKIPVDPNTIYYFDFCNTLTIDAATTYDLKQNGLDYKINISDDFEGSMVTINANAETGAKPANISINARGHKIGNLVVNTPDSHVEVSNGESVSAKAITSLNTFVVKGDYKITGTGEGQGLTVEKGNVFIEGDKVKVGATNVAQVIIPSGVTEQIKIDVSGVSTPTEDNRVKIVNQSSPENVVVVPDNVNDQKSYQVEQGQVTLVSKEAVAMIGTEGYETLKAAVNAVPVDNQTSVTIKVIKDVVLKNADAFVINKNKVVLDGQGHTIALDETDATLNKYLVDGANKKYGSFQMIKVSGNDVVLKNMTLDSKNYRGASLATTVGGKNVVYENIIYNGKGSAHYYSTNNNGLITFKNCKINTCGYGVHSDTAEDGIVIEGCEIHGWNAFGAAVKKVSINNSKFYGSEDKHNGTLAAFSIYCPTTFTECTFSKEFVKAGTYEGIFFGKNSPALVSLNDCSIEEGELYQMVRTDDPDWPAGAVVAIDATGNATAGFTAGTFVAKKAEDIKAAAGYEAYAIEGKTDIYGFPVSKDANGNYHIVNADGLLQFRGLYAAGKVAYTAKVYLENDINFTGKTWDACEWFADSNIKGFALFDGQNHTIKNFTVNGQGMFSRWACTSNIGATPHFKDIVFDGAKNVTSTLNVSLFCGQCYQNATIENVTIKNSQFEGTYKVAPFVGTVYDEKPANTVTLTMKDCKVENTTVRSTKYNYCTCGMVAWVSDIDDQDKIVFEGNNVVKDVTLYKSNVSYNLFGKIYWGDGVDDGVAHDEAANVTVTNVNVVKAQ